LLFVVVEVFALLYPCLATSSRSSICCVKRVKVMPSW